MGAYSTMSQRAYDIYAHVNSFTSQKDLGWALGVRDRENGEDKSGDIVDNPECLNGYCLGWLQMDQILSD